MKLKQWFKGVYLFPFAIFMGNIGETSTVTSPEGGAVPNAQTAEAGANQEVTSEGAVPETRTAEGEKSENAEISQGQEGQQTAEGNNDRGAHQKSLEERAREIAREELAAYLQQRQAEERPTFSPPEVEAQVQRNILANNARLREIEEEARLSENGQIPEEMYAEYWQRRQFVAGAEEALNRNQQERAAWEQRQQQTQQQEQYRQQVQADIDAAVNSLVAYENTPPEVAAKGREFFNSELKAKPFLQLQFDNIILGKAAFQGYNGAVGAAMMAIDYVKQHMGKKEESIIQQIETAKESLPSGVTNTGVTVGNPQLDALKARAQASGNTDDLARYMAAKKQAA